MKIEVGETNQGIFRTWRMIITKWGVVHDFRNEKKHCPIEVICVAVFTSFLCMQPTMKTLTINAQFQLIPSVVSKGFHWFVYYLLHVHFDW